jgi:hypothetical protein
MEAKPGTVTKSASIGSDIARSISLRGSSFHFESCALAPGHSVRTNKDGCSIAGSKLSGSLSKEMMPKLSKASMTTKRRVCKLVYFFNF